MSNEKKICPLLMMTPTTPLKQNFNCLEDECAWWDNKYECCGIMSISGELDNLNGNLGTIYGGTL